MTPLRFVDAVRADLAEWAPGGGFRRAAKIVLISSGFHAGLLYRVTHSVRPRFGLAGRALSGILVWFSYHWYGCIVSPTARIAGGLVLVHPRGVHIGQEAIIGPRAWIYQNVTVGPSASKTGMPVIGADVHIYTGAVVVGPIRIGDGVSIGANCVLWRDVPSGAEVRPAQPEVHLK
ncbi:MAG: serine acetyltransferase [Bryobacteraceae bacterium]